MKIEIDIVNTSTSHLRDVVRLLETELSRRPDAGRATRQRTSVITCGKIELIKRVRANFHVSLKDGKDFVDSLPIDWGSW